MREKEGVAQTQMGGGDIIIVIMHYLPNAVLRINVPTLMFRQRLGFTKNSAWQVVCGTFGSWCRMVAELSSSYYCIL